MSQNAAGNVCNVNKTADVPPYSCPIVVVDIDCGISILTGRKRVSDAPVLLFVFLNGLAYVRTQNIIYVKGKYTVNTGLRLFSDKNENVNFTI